jgi:hypothetical protein
MNFSGHVDLMVSDHTHSGDKYPIFQLSMASGKESQLQFWSKIVKRGFPYSYPARPAKV